MLSIAIPVLVFVIANVAIFFTGNSGSNLLFYLLFGTASIALYYLVFMAVLHFIPNTLFDKITIVQWSPYVKKVAISVLLPLLTLTALTIYAPFEKTSGFINLKLIALFVYPGGLPGTILSDEYKGYLRNKPQKESDDRIVSQKEDAVISGSAVVFVLPTTERLKEMENKYGEEFHAVADDAMFYQKRAENFLKDKSVQVFTLNAKDVLRFKLSSGELVEEDLSKLPYWNGLLFNGIEKPIIVDFILIENDYNRYMINTNKTNPQAVSNDNPSVSKFLGSWTWISNDKSAAFGFDLKQGSDPNSVHGTMCGSFYFGNKSDCDPYNEDALIGILNGNILNLKFISTWGGNGEATLISNSNGSVSWEITKEPTEFHYLPKSATLVPER